MTSKPEFIYISLENAKSFDWSKIVIKDPVQHQSKDGQHKWTTSEPRWIGVIDGVKYELPIYFDNAEQIIWGLNGKWPDKIDDVKIREDQKTRENLNGLQIGYPMTSDGTVDNPTEDEENTKYIYDQQWKIGVEYMKKFYKEKKLPKTTMGSYLLAQAENDWALAYKQPYAYQKTENKQSKQKFVDKTKPQKIYIDLYTSGSGLKINCLTEVYGPGNVLVKGDKIFKYYGSFAKPIRGKAFTAICWDSVYWGTHGDTGCGGSNRYRVARMNYVPVKSVANVPKGLPFRPNLAPKEEDVSDDDGDFPNPMGGNDNKGEQGEQDDSNFGTGDSNVDKLLTANLNQKTNNNTTKTNNKSISKTSGSDGENSEGENGEDDNQDNENEVTEPKSKAIPTKAVNQSVPKKVTLTPNSKKMAALSVKKVAAKKNNNTDI